MLMLDKRDSVVLFDIVFDSVFLHSMNKPIDLQD